ncbi:MAG: hypothetical protein ACRDTC_08130 [Pseudonocardiaceae bacterium]
MAGFWLQQPDEALLLKLPAGELDQRPAASVGAGQRSERVGPSEGAPVRPFRRLSGVELVERIALRRVGGGGVVMLGAHYLDHGRKVPCYLPEVFGRLADTGLTALLDPDHPGGLRRVVITSPGRVRYQELSAMRSPAAGPDHSSGDGVVFADRPLLGSRPVRAAGVGAGG